MDKSKEYRCLVKQLLQEFADWVNAIPQINGKPRPENEELVCIFDEERDQYLVFDAIWGEYRCLRSVKIFVRLRNGKIWIEEDWTEEGFATDLLESGVPRDDIVLGFQPPEMRQYTEFAVA